jgi:hypothetical protein
VLASQRLYRSSAAFSALAATPTHHVYRALRRPPDLPSTFGALHPRTSGHSPRKKAYSSGQMGTKPMGQSYEPADIADLGELAEQARMLRAALERVRNELAVAAAAEEALVSKLRELGVSVEGIGVGGGTGGTANGENTLAGPFGGAQEETTKTQIDTFEIPGLPKSRRGGGRSGASAGSGVSTAITQQGMLKAAAAGAGLMLGLAVFVLLVINLASSKKDAAPSSTTPSSLSGPTTPARPLDDSRQIPPPPETPPVIATAPPVVASAAPAIVSAVVPAAKPVAANVPEGVSTLTVVCTPRCDSVTSDNNSLGGSPTNIPIAPGTHKLTLSAPNGVKKTLMVNINQGQAREVRVSMEQGSPHDYGF